MRSGFTLVELLIVIAMIAILAGMTTLISIQGSLGRGNDARRKADLELIRTALEKYKNVNGNYPISCGWVNYIYNGQYGQKSLAEQNLVPNYINALPVDPSGNTSGQYSYMYATPGCTSTPALAESYALWAQMQVSGDSDTSLFNQGVNNYDSGYGMNYKVINPQ